MFLEKLDLINFKNICSVSITFSSKISCFVGNNGAGKTNILDAIHFLSLCKSSLGMSDRMCILHEKEFFMVEGNYSMEDRSLEHIMLSYKRGDSKKLKRNDKEYTKIADHIGLLPAVMISPSDSSIINEASEERRRYINSLISQIDRNYLNQLIKYNTLLSQRNNLLKQIKNDPNNREVLEIIDEQIAEVGDKIHAKRAQMVEKIAPIVSHYYQILSKDSESVEIKYLSQINENGSLKLLRSSFEKDVILTHTTTGIHRDDIKMEIMGFPIRRYGSQGQQKSFIIALKLAQFDLIAEDSGIKPILLLDDVFDKLDLERVEELIKIVGQPRFGQIFITDCNKLRLETILNKASQGYSLFKIEDGDIKI